METNQNNTKTGSSEEKNTPFKISGDWNAQSKEIKAKFSQLSDNDLKFETGKENELLSRLETKLGKKREEVISIIQKHQTTPTKK